MAEFERIQPCPIRSNLPNRKVSAKGLVSDLRNWKVSVKDLVSEFPNQYMCVKAFKNVKLNGSIAACSSGR